VGQEGGMESWDDFHPAEAARNNATRRPRADGCSLGDGFQGPGSLKK